MNQEPEPVHRPSGRALLVDERDRVLLFRVEPPDRDIELWITPGGGLDRGESSREAARRELWEETGLRAAQLGPWVWKREHLFTWGEATVASTERYFLVRVGRVEVRPAGMTEEELRFVREHRWWSVEEIHRSRGTFVPRRLGELLGPILRGEIPDRPIDTGV
ncbi:MAG: NUDIX domain-containing protein [Myxococcota bacterium]